MAEPISALTGATAGVNILTPTVEPEGGSSFQKLLDNALGALENISKTEQKANAYIQEYVQGNVSMEDVLIEATKMQLAMELAITIVNQSVSTFKEIQQMQV
ncbi:MAG: flagellar hook-basal body complex protein FliE [Candidatus Margulisbacteria bacterium]|nr:flagellar hook-basal body complex protein FliE [Candidatus Margulisiibacteriota bacterium]